MGWPVRVLIADDRAAVRDGLRAILETSPDIRVVGEAADGVEAESLARQLRPDVLVLEQTMPRRGGAEVAAALCDRRPEIAVLLYTADARVAAHLPPGVLGALTNDVPPSRMVEMVRQAARVVALRASIVPAPPRTPWWLGLAEIALPLRYGRRFGASSFSFVFLAAFGEFHGLSTLGLSASGFQFDAGALQQTLLPMDWLVAAAAAGVAYAIFARRPAHAVVSR